MRERVDSNIHEVRVFHKLSPTTTQSFRTREHFAFASYFMYISENICQRSAISFARSEHARVRHEGKIEKFRKFRKSEKIIAIPHLYENARRTITYQSEGQVYEKSPGGTGDLLNATLTMDGSDEGQLTVFAGPCEQLVCIDGSVRRLIAAIIVPWMAEEGRTYYLLVQSGLSSNVDYELSIRPVGDLPSGR